MIQCTISRSLKKFWLPFLIVVTTRDKIGRMKSTCWAWIGYHCKACLTALTSFDHWFRFCHVCWMRNKYQSQSYTWILNNQNCMNKLPNIRKIAYPSESKGQSKRLVSPEIGDFTKDHPLTLRNHASTSSHIQDNRTQLVAPVRYRFEFSLTSNNPQ